MNYFYHYSHICRRIVASSTTNGLCFQSSSSSSRKMSSVVVIARQQSTQSSFSSQSTTTTTTTSSIKAISNQNPKNHPSSQNNNNPTRTLLHHNPPTHARHYHRRRHTLSSPPPTQNKIHFQSLGCPRNWVDSEVMLGIVLQHGYEITPTLQDANYVVLNTCGFLKEARLESKRELERILEQVVKERGGKVVVTGCMINLHREEILREYPMIHRVLGSGAVEKILHALSDDDENDNENDDKTINVDARSYLEHGEVPRAVVTPKHYAYVKIAEGCRKRCSFCVIPKIKGGLRSKPVEQVVKECCALLEGGNGKLKELVLIAQDLGDYGKDLSLFSSSGGEKEEDDDDNVQLQQKEAKKNGQLAQLLRQILQNTSQHKHYWLRLMYLYPDEITDDILSVMSSDERICPYVDMPIQHINNDILRNMRRKTSGKDIQLAIQKLRRVLPNVVIRTSLMVGFPGETEEQFQELLEFVREYKLDHVGVFMYSNEEMAASFRLRDQISEEVKQDRYDRLMKVQLEVVLERNEERVRGKERLEVVVEGLHEEYENVVVGRYYGQCPDIDGQILITDWKELGGKKKEETQGMVWPEPGERYMVELTDYLDYDLIGRIVVD